MAVNVPLVMQGNWGAFGVGHVHVGLHMCPCLEESLL